MPIKLIVGHNYQHPTLGLVKLTNLTDEEQATILVLTNNFVINSSGEWQDDWGHHFKCDKGDEWEVKVKTLKSPFIDPKDKGKSPVQIRCRKLWNSSNWVKQHPQQAY